MARASGLLAVLPLLLMAAGTAGAADPELCGGRAARDGSYVALVDREHPLVLELDPRGPTRTVAIRGRLCDRAGRPLATHRLELWRFDGDLPQGDEAPTTDDFAAGAAFEPLQQWSLRSSAAGVFTATGLAPGSYALAPEWQGVAARQQYLLLEIQVIPGFDTAAPVHGGGASEPVPSRVQ